MVHSIWSLSKRRRKQASLKRHILIYTSQNDQIGFKVEIADKSPDVLFWIEKMVSGQRVS